MNVTGTYRVIRVENFEVTFGQLYADIWRKNISSRENSQCKFPKAVACMLLRERAREWCGWSVVKEVCLGK